MEGESAELSISFVGKMTFNDDEPIVETQDDSGEKPAPFQAGKTSLKIINKNEAPLEESKFKVMLELTGAGSGNERPGLDLVMVLDVSESMDGNKLKKMIIATLSVIKKLSPIDRLSVVTFGENSTRLCPLRQMTEHSQWEIENLVNALVAKGGTNIAAGLQTGLQVLNDRSHTRGRTVGIMLLSDGSQTKGDATKVPVSKVPVFTFGYGEDQDPQVLKAIADNSPGGTFSDIQNVNNLSIAFSQCLAAFLSVVVQDLKLTVTKVESTIEKVSAGNYPLSRDDTAGSVTISFGDLYPKEIRKVIVDLLLPAVSSRALPAFSSKVNADVLEINYAYSAGGVKVFEANPILVNITRIDKNRVRTARAMAIVLNRGIGVSGIGISNHMSWESGVAVVNFSTSWVNRPGEYNKYQIVSEPRNLEANRPILKTMVMADEKKLEDAQKKLVEAENLLEDVVDESSNPLIEMLKSELQQLLTLEDAQEKLVEAENFLEDVTTQQNAASSSPTTNKNEQHGEVLSPSFETMIAKDLNFVNLAWKKYTDHMNAKIYVARKEFKRLQNLGSIKGDFDELREAIAKLKSQIPPIPPQVNILSRTQTKDKAKSKQLENNHQNEVSCSETTKKNDQHGEGEALPPSSKMIPNDLRLVNLAWKKYKDHMHAKISVASKEFKRLQRKYANGMNAQINMASEEFNQIDFYKLQKAINNLKSHVEGWQIPLTSNEDDHDGGALYQMIGSELNLLVSAFDEAQKFKETDFDKFQKAIEKLKSTCFDKFQNAIANLMSQVKKLQIPLTSNEDDHNGGALYQKIGSELILLALAFDEAKKFKETDFEKIQKAIENLKLQVKQVKELQIHLTSNEDDHNGGVLSQMFGSDLDLLVSAFEEAQKFLKSTGGEINQASAKSNEPQKANSEKQQKGESSKLRKDIFTLRVLIRSYGEIRSTNSNGHPYEWPDINGVGEERMHFFFQESNEHNTEGVNGDKMMDKFKELTEPERCCLDKYFKELRESERCCLLCFFKFPPEEFIKRATMIYLWIGIFRHLQKECLSKEEKDLFLEEKHNTKGEEKELSLKEDAGKKIFDKLITKGFIERSSLEANSCKMSPSARSSLYQEAKDRGFTSNGNHDLEEESVRGELIGHSCLINVGEAIINCKPKIFGKMEHIRSLYLGRWWTSATHHIELADTKILHGMRKLNNLTFLSLRGISLITELPKFIAELNALKILDLRACHNLESIPDEISSLKELTHLDMSDCYFLEHMPKSLAQLSNLKVLKGFFIGEFKMNKSTCTLKDLSRLPKLGKLNIYTSVKNFPYTSDLESLKEFKGLQKLTISWGGCSSPGKIVDTKASASQEEGEETLYLRLQKLDLQGFPLRRLPYWLRPSNLKELRKLYIRGGNLRDLGQLPENKGEHWNVEILHLKFLDALEINWSKLMILFPKLIYLHPKECSKLNFQGYERSVWSEWKGEESSVWMDKKAIDAMFWLQKIFRSHGVSLSSLLGYDPVD